MGERIGSLFSGAGGLDLAVREVFGGDVVWHCEVDKAASKVLAYRFPCAPNLGDITAVGWSAVEPVDVLCGGYPCQPFSQAGKRRGVNDKRHLWPFVAAAIRTLRPTYAVLENVSGHRSLGFSEVHADLASLRYDTQWCSVRASDVGAPHHRERVFILAVSSDTPGASKGAYLSEGRVPAQHRGSPVKASSSSGYDFGAFEPVVRRWEKLTRSAPDPVRITAAGVYLSPEFAEWLMGWPAGWVTDPAIGISRNDQLRIIGNGVCPQQAIAALQFLLPVSEVTK